MFTATEDVWLEFATDDYTAVGEARAMDRAYGAGSWIAMVKHYEEEERFATFREDENPTMCPACRAKLGNQDGFWHEEGCAWVPWCFAVEEAILRGDEY